MDDDRAVLRGDRSEPRSQDGELGLKRGLRWLIVAAALVAAAPPLAPQLLAFPYRSASHGSEVWSDKPLPQRELDAVVGRSMALVAQSPLASAAETRHIFLTDGGWRWTWLSLTSGGPFGLTRALNEAVLINRSDLARDRVWNGAAIGGERTLSGVIAHEFCHGMERRAFGIWVDLTKPAWLREGYCDVVARESSLTAADVARLRAAGRDHPALIYYEGRRRIEAELSRNGGDVRALFARY